MIDRSLPIVTVLVPARQEAGHVGPALAAVLEQDYPRERMQVLVVDGASTDGTADLARSALEGQGLLEGRVVLNDAVTTPSNLNMGLEHAKGEYLCRVDARSRIPRDYVRRCVETLMARPDVVVVGGRQVARPRADDPISLGIARALNNRFVMGLSRYRRGATSGRADTVYLGAFRTSQLRAVGGWDEAMHTNQDFDLSRRLSRLGPVWFDARLAVGYLPRESLGALFTQYDRFGRWKVRYWRRSGDRPRPRQMILLAAPLAAALLCAELLLDRSLARRALVGGAVAVAAVSGEVRGSSSPPAPAAGHAVALLASLVVASGWVAGVVREQLGTRSSTPTAPLDGRAS